MVRRCVAWEMWGRGGESFGGLRRYGGMAKAHLPKAQFSVHAKGADPRGARIIAEDSAAAAAAAFIEDIGFAPGADEHVVQVIVRNLAGGKEHCVRIDLDTGAAAPCP